MDNSHGETLRTIPVKAYTVGGSPTCATDYQSGKCCRFAGSRKFGLIAVCNFLGRDIDYRNEVENGYSTPLPDCPVWSNINCSDQQNDVR